MLTGTKSFTGFAPAAKPGMPGALPDRHAESAREVDVGAPAGEPELAQHRREGDHRPHGLLTVRRALQREAPDQLGARACHPPREGADRGRRDVGDRHGPLRRLRLAVRLSRSDSRRTRRIPPCIWRGNAVSWRFSVYSTCASARISAVSVFGRIAIRSVRRYWSVSLSIGFTDTTGVPLSRSWARYPASKCPPSPPDSTSAFTSGSYPKSTTRVAFWMIVGHADASGRGSPRTCGSDHRQHGRAVRVHVGDVPAVQAEHPLERLAPPHGTCRRSASRSSRRRLRGSRTGSSPGLISPATMSSASSHETRTNGSVPRPIVSLLDRSV